MKKPMKKAPAKATAKKISEYGGKEMYASKSAMMKHEKGEGKKVEKKEGAAFAKKTMAKKSPAKKAMKMPYGN